VKRLLLPVFAALLAASLLASAVPGSEPTAVPTLKILTPRGGQTSKRVVEISGRVAGVEAERLTLVLNGVPLSSPRYGETFKSNQVLAPGWNSIRVRAEAKGVSVEDSVAVFARVPRKDLRIAMTWDTPRTDVDLWVTGPDKEKVFYSHSQGAQGGILDVDVTTGYGPETYTQARTQPGLYRIQAHFYGRGPPTRVTVTLIRGEGTARETRRIFRGTLLRKGEVLEVGTFTAN
jgi:uncharacterized protein YfaP (DUF2135 family)